jgi:hypothetical protein
MLFGIIYCIGAHFLFFHICSPIKNLTEQIITYYRGIFHTINPAVLRRVLRGI